MSELSEMLGGFDYEYTMQDMIDYLASQAMANQTTVHALREFTLTKLSEILNITYEDLQKDFNQYYSTYQRNAVADFLGKFGTISDSPDSQ